MEFNVQAEVLTVAAFVKAARSVPPSLLAIERGYQTAVETWDKAIVDNMAKVWRFGRLQVAPRPRAKG